MGRTILEMQSKANILASQMYQFLLECKYNECDDLSELEINWNDPEQLLLRDELRVAADHMAKAYQTIRYLAEPVKSTSKLRLNSTGRYETEDGFVFTCGSLIEALVDDGVHDGPYWTVTSVEYGPNGYYLVGHRDVCLNGLTVRFRK